MGGLAWENGANGKIVLMYWGNFSNKEVYTGSWEEQASHSWKMKLQIWKRITIINTEVSNSNWSVKYGFQQTDTCNHKDREVRTDVFIHMHIFPSSAH